MGKEQDTEWLPGFSKRFETGQAREEVSRVSENQLYQAIEAAYAAKVEQLQQTGELRRLSQIANEEELDDHFDELSRLYRQTCREMCPGRRYLSGS